MRTTSDLAPENSERPYQLRWPVRSMGVPLIDIDDKESLYGTLDADVARD